MRDKYFILLTLVLFITLILINSKSIRSSSSDKNKAIVIAKNGLVMRKKDDRSSTKITTIPFNKTVKVIYKLGRYEEISNLKANWVVVKYKQYTGWVFGGYLELPPEAYKSLMSYYEQNGAIKTLNKFARRFEILIEDIPASITNVGAPISKKIYAFVGMGGVEATLINVKENKDGIVFIVYAIYYDENYNKEKCKCFKAYMSNDLLKQMIHGRFIRYHLDAIEIPDSKCSK